jgi:hypothetical protein
LLAGYGKAPFRSFFVGLFFVILAAIFIFDPRYLKLQALKWWNLDYDLKLRDYLKNGRIFKDPSYIKKFTENLILAFHGEFRSIHSGRKSGSGSPLGTGRSLVYEMVFCLPPQNLRLDFNSHWPGGHSLAI